MNRLLHIISAVLLALFIAACSSGSSPTGSQVDLNGQIIVAFGNSITAGLGDTNYPTGPAGYPFRLQQMLQAGYPNVLVRNRGWAGEKTGAGVSRLRSVLTYDQPDYVLILEGVNNANNGGTGQVPGIIRDLTSMVTMVKAAGATPLIASLTPAFGRNSWKSPTIAAANPLIRNLAASQNIPFVDLNATFASQPSLSAIMIGDGLHPNATGYQLMANDWFSALLALL